MSIWLIMGTVSLAGAVGGVLNALMSDNGFVLPQSAETEEGKILRPGYLGNIFIGAVAAFISWGLYGPFADYPLFKKGATADLELTIAALVGAIMIGVGGARWLTNEVDKTMLRTAASQAAAGGANVDIAAKLSMASPARALELTSKPKAQE